MNPSSFPGRRALAWLCAAATLAGAVYTGSAAAQAYPSRPIRVISPFVAGGLNDWLTRYVAKGIGDALQATVVVENRPGGGTIPATEYVAKSAPDGYTLLLSSNTALAIAPGLYPKLPFNVATDFSFVAIVGNGPYLVLVRNDLPVKNMAELIAHAKANPGKLSFGSTGNATPAHLGGELLKSMAGIDMVHVPYKGSTPALTDLAGGQIDIDLDPVGSSAALMKAGKIRAIAITSPARTPLMPDLPAVSETLKDYEVNVLYGLIGPAGIPKDVVTRLNAAVVKYLNSPESAEQLRTRGVDPTQSTPESFAAAIRNETQKWAKVIKASGAKPD